MCYVIVKNKNKRGCYALKAKHGNELVQLKNKLEASVKKDVQVVLISRPSAYGEYAPYNFADSEDELMALAVNA
ncbi:MAG: hypothetical protein J6P79_05175 [Pseudobutyrivibrio sp.]|nr:hypothetical protein [Pseudobutyrivibrio sp.]